MNNKVKEKINKAHEAMEAKKNQGGRPRGTVKDGLSASQRITGLTNRIAQMIEKQVDLVDRDLRKIEADEGQIPNPQTCNARIEISNSLVKMMEGLTKVQKMKILAGEEEGDEDGVVGTGEEIVRLLSGGK